MIQRDQVLIFQAVNTNWRQRLAFGDTTNLTDNGGIGYNYVQFPTICDDYDHSVDHAVALVRFRRINHLRASTGWAVRVDVQQHTGVFVLVPESGSNTGPFLLCLCCPAGL